MSNRSLKGAGGAAGAIYKWLGIDQDEAFAKDVSAAVKRPGDAKLHVYVSQVRGRSVHVIHAVGPDLRKDDPSPEHAHSCLVEAYENIFREFLCSEQKLLRLLPVSAGIFAGTFAKDMPKMTMAAMPEAKTAPASAPSSTSSAARRATSRSRTGASSR